jgi:hypothetical protein
MKFMGHRIAGLLPVCRCAYKLAAAGKFPFFWDVTQFSLVYAYRRFRGTCCLHPQISHIGTYYNFLGAFAKLRNATVGFVMSFRPSGPDGWNNSAATGRVFMKIYIWVFFENFPENSCFIKIDKSSGYSLWTSVYIYISISLIFFRIRNVSDRRCRGNQNIHFVFSKCVSNIVPFMR